MKNVIFLRTVKLIRSKGLYWTGQVGFSLAFLLTNLFVAVWYLNTMDAAVAGDIDALARTSLIFFIVLCATCIYYCITSYLYERSVIETTVHLRQRLFDHIQRLPFSSLKQKHSGDLVSRTTNDLVAMEAVYSSNLQDLLTAAVGAVGALVAMLIINWQMAIVAFIYTVITTSINIPFQKPLRNKSRQYQEALSALTQVLSNLLAGIQVARVFDLEEKITSTYQHQNKTVVTIARSRAFLGSLLGAINSFASFSSLFGLVVLGGYFILKGRATLGEVVYMTQLAQPIIYFLESFGGLLGQFQYSLAGAERIFNILDSEPEPKQYKLKTFKTATSAAIAFNEVSFWYEPKMLVFNRLSLTVPYNQIWALVGPSGGGKSTLLSLLLGLYPPCAGDIIINGLLLSQTPLQKIREQIAYVPQESYLYSSTIAANIACGKPGANQTEIEAAAKIANAHDFIKTFPQGYQTMVGERGVYLSGGQKQRLAIARAVLKDASILLLDEATASLDTASEQLIQLAFSRLTKGRTTLMVAHRLSTIKNAHQILVVDKGKIVQQGTHRELANKHGIYQDLLKFQFSRADSA